ncbi:MAG: hypothetical protein QNJ91_12305 [Gammaproteobacteria bacterium]|nr:hypothetical protein [Gammaproteobacteria bacterium]
MSTTDRRLWSTTPRKLRQFVDALAEVGIPPLSVRDLQVAMREHAFYPARDLPQFVAAEPPDAFFTYHSAQPVGEVQQNVVQTARHAIRGLHARRPELPAERLDDLFMDGVRIWVDFLFIDQSARDLRSELDALPAVLDACDIHVVLGTQPLTRAWCCYEIALFNRRLVDAAPAGGRDAAPLLSLIAPTRNYYRGWDRTAVTDPADKAFIGARIDSDFPGGFAGFDHVMAQANSVATLSTAGGGTWSTPAADAALLAAAERWYARSLPATR